MPRILDRYVLREILPPFFLSLLILTFLLTLPPVMRQLEQLVAKGVTWDVAARIVVTLIPQALGLTIPMATLTGILIGLGRLSADRESVALLACGVSPYRLLRPLLAFALINTGATAYVMFQAIPDANQAFRDITWDLISKRVENDIQPRVFFEDFPGYTLYVRDLEPGGRWKDVLVANTTKPEATELSMAASGRLVLDRDNRRVDLYLANGTRYATGPKERTETYRFAGDLFISLDADSVFGKQAIPRTVTEKSIAELQADAVTKLNRPEGAHSPHPEIIYIQQKFSIPMACLVFAAIGLALGLSSARDGKMGAFVIAFAVVFVYYAILIMAESHTKGYYRGIQEVNGLHAASFFLAHMARWWPNIVMGLFGVGALIWRVHFAHRGLPGLPVSLPISLPRFGSPDATSVTLPAGAGAAGTSAETGVHRSAPARRKNVVIVLRLPRFALPTVRLLDRYVSRLYIRVVGLSFLGLMGLFYIATLLDKLEKVFKGDAPGSLLASFLVYSTPQFIYWVIPLAALLSVLVTFGALARSSELTVMKACGISLYRAAMPIIAMSLVGSAILFGLEQRVLAEWNRKATAADRVLRGLPPQNLNPMNRRWIVAPDRSIYHYGFFDGRSQTLTMLSVFRLPPDRWALASHTYATMAEFRDGTWVGRNGWTRDYRNPIPAFEPFTSRPLSVEPPDYFGAGTPIAELMTVPELRQHIQELENTGMNVNDLRVELQRKMAFPFVTVVMSLIAVPFGITTGRRGALYGIGLGIVIALSYWIMQSVFIAIGGAGLLPPVLAGWSANVIVAGLAAYLFLNTRT